MLKQIPINELTPGMMVTAVIEQHGPVKIRRVGLVKSDAMVKGLKEMGVSLLEVDEAQSITVESERSASAELTVAPLTPTQQLMAKDKQSAAVDRQLSQQFHRSLFMPAIDEMPSKWRVYYRPYVLLIAFILFGFTLGIVTVNVFTQASSFLNNATSATDSSAAGTQLENQSPAEPEQSIVAKSNLLASNSADSESALEQTQLAESSPPMDALPEPELKNKEQSTSLSNVSVPESEGQSASMDEPETARSVQTFNGIVLNEGETVLGYGAPEAELAKPETSEGEQEASPTSSLSADLLNRVNRAAAELEAEQEIASLEQREPLDLTEFLQDESSGPVVDLRVPRSQAPPPTKDTLRIDQLPAAILTQMPAMSFSAHMFASNPQDRWVRVNGRRLSEGDFIEDGLSIVEIESERVVLSFKGETFTMNALSDW